MLEGLITGRGIRNIASFMRQTRHRHSIVSTLPNAKAPKIPLAELRKTKTAKGGAQSRARVLIFRPMYFLR